MPARYLPEPNSPSFAIWSATENATPQDTLRVTSRGMESFVGDCVASSNTIPYFAAALDQPHGQLCGPLAELRVLEQFMTLIDRAHQRVQAQMSLVGQFARHLRRPARLLIEHLAALFHLK